MKRNDWAILLSVLLYSILFYKQTAGINFLIFNIALVGLLVWRNVQLTRSKAWLSVATGALISSFFIFMYGSALAIWADLFSLFILSALSIDPNTSFLIGIFLTICSVGSSLVFMFIDWVKRKSREVTETYKRPFYVKLFLIVVPFLVAVLFFFFYQNSNPLFYDFTKNINLDFISIVWILFTYSGLLLMYGFFYNRRIPGISDLDGRVALDLDPETAGRKNFLNGLMRTDTENISGVILFSMLNILLLIVNILDINYFIFDGKLPKGIGHKAFVHDGIGTLITSLIVAIIIILFYFRGELNFLKNAKGLKILAFFWIAQNIFMIFSTAYRNNLYIQESGISYKKIGVYVYLILTLIGLVTTFIKIIRLKTNWYLFRVNAAVYYYFIVIGCTFNWDVIITDFNIRKYTEEHKKLEKYLLVDLSYKNLPQLLALPPAAKNADDPEARDYYNYLRGTSYYNFKTGLARKLYDFLDEYGKMEWPSFCWEKKRTYHDIYEMRQKVDSLEFQYFDGSSLRPIGIFSELRSLDLQAGKFASFHELKYFPKLEYLDLSSSGIDTLQHFPPLPHLKRLVLTGNNIHDITPLGGLRNLEELELSGDNNNITNFSALLRMKKLKHLSIGKMTPHGLEVLQHLLPQTEITANIVNVDDSTVEAAR
ncbi:MAG: DUF4153 domain-containing protein [Bacteroidia bacterium]